MPQTAHMDVDVIRTPRLELVLMSVPFMEALARRDIYAASREIDARVPLWMADELDGFLQMRLAQLSVEPQAAEWLGRSMVLTTPAGERRVIGSIGFHGPPDEEGRVEIGYSVDPPYRRQGYARESVEAMFGWAHEKHSVTLFRAAVLPGNEPSLNLIRQFGFVKVGEQLDEIDGLEYIFDASWPFPAREARISQADR